MNEWIKADRQGNRLPGAVSRLGIIPALEASERFFYDATGVVSAPAALCRGAISTTAKRAMSA